jgi:N-acetyl sugar amidotransferase
MNYSKQCSKCLMDDSDPDIYFDDQGVCCHCHQYLNRLDKELPNIENSKEILEKLVIKIKEKGKHKKYDCIIGLSGGVDSSYVAYIVNKLGLRTLAVHLDNGWNSELAVSNIEKLVKNLDTIDLHTHVLDWIEFKEIQKAFFLASVPNCEMPTDHSIMAVLFKLANKFKIKYIISGSNLTSEGITIPVKWGRDYRDKKHLVAINKTFGSQKIKTFPTLSILKLLYLTLIKRIKFLPILNYCNYNKAEAIKILKRELGWTEYGRKHGESLFTRFFQEYYLPEKFGFDKRKLHYSVLINSGQMTKAQAEEELNKPMFNEDEKKEMITYVRKKLGLSEDDWNDIMTKDPSSHMDYPTNICFTLRDKPLAQFIRKIATGR